MRLENNNTIRSVKILIFLATLLINIISFAFAGSMRAESPVWRTDISPKDTSEEDYFPDRLIVKFKPSISPSERDSVLQSIGVRISKTLNYISGISICEVVDTSKSIKEILAQLADSGIVEYAEPDYNVHIDNTLNAP